MKGQTKKRTRRGKSPELEKDLGEGRLKEEGEKEKIRRRNEGRNEI